MVHPVQYGKRERMSYSRIDDVLEIPNLLGVQTDSFKWLIDEGLGEVFRDISPIEDFAGNLILEFVDYYVSEEKKYDFEEAKEKDTNYSAPLKVKVRLINTETGEVKEQEVFMGDLPLMSDTGTFVINGAERVVVSQLVRSPGAYYKEEFDKTGKRLYSATLIPNRGAWLEFETDAQGVVNVRIDRTRKIPITILLRAIGVESNLEITRLMGESEELLKVFEKDQTSNKQEALLEIYKKLRPGEPPTIESAQSLFENMFFDARRYDMAKVGRYKFNKKLALRERLQNQVLAEDVIDGETGEIMGKAGDRVSREEAVAIENAGINRVEIVIDDPNELGEKKNIVLIGNNFVDTDSLDLDIDFEALGFKEKIYLPRLQELLDEYEGEELLARIKLHYKELTPKHILIDDILAAVNYEFNLFYGIGKTDDIDHLGNRRIRSVGELLQNQFRIGLTRMERVIRERMAVQDPDGATPQSLINIRPVTAAIKEFFGSSQLSQFMDQNNPLSELTHKRRLSALGPGGLSRDRAGMEVRDVHNSHYGRMCPIETPEGPNIGLITSLTTFARINEYGFIEAPYRKVIKGEGKVTDQVEYITADVEDENIIAQADEKLDENGHFINSRVIARGYGGAVDVYKREDISYMDVSPQQIVAVGTSMIPFL